MNSVAKKEREDEIKEEKKRKGKDKKHER